MTAQQRGRFDGEGVTGNLQWWHRVGVTVLASLLVAALVGIAVAVVAGMVLVLAVAGREASR